jgi:hypothetical protein
MGFLQIFLASAGTEILGYDRTIEGFTITIAVFFAVLLLLLAISLGILAYKMRGLGQQTSQK